MRYEFGKNWSSYLESHFELEKVEEAGQHLLDFLNLPNLEGLTFVDIGCGSGIHSLAALMAGAKSVTSFDYDQNSVEATRSVKKMYGNPKNWEISQGSILDPAFVRKLGHYDIVYSWGVLHHTGDMWNAVRAARTLMKQNSIFYIALYGKEIQIEPTTPEYWLELKRQYNIGGALRRRIMEWQYALHFFIWPDIVTNFKNIIISIIRLSTIVPIRWIPREKLNGIGNATGIKKLSWLGDKITRRAILVHEKKHPYIIKAFKNPLKYLFKTGRERKRGMDFWVDIRDWLGGYPMEFAGNSETKNFCKKTLDLEVLNIRAGEACTEYTFCQTNDSENLAGFRPYRERTLMNGPFEQFGSVGWKYELPPEISNQISKKPGKQNLMILESAIPLGWEIEAEEEEGLRIVGNEGKGRHGIVGNVLYFSASDSSPPNTNNKTYEVAIL